jgi:tRNA G26 N,N-dimethylase Trm1
MEGGPQTTYWHCPRCRLAIAERADGQPPPPECPRCRTYSDVSSPLFPSPLTARELRDLLRAQAEHVAGGAERHG